MNATVIYPYEERNGLVIYKHGTERRELAGGFTPWLNGETVETFTVPRHMKCLSESLLSGFAGLLAKKGYDSRRAYDVALSITEAVSNALKQDGPVVWNHHLVARGSVDTLVLLLHTPESPAFDPTTLATYDPSDPEHLLCPHRRGFLIMREHADTLAYSKDGRETILEFDLPKTEKALNPAFSSNVA